MKRRRRRNRIVPVLIVLLVLALVCAVLLKFVFIVRYVDVRGNSGTVTQDGVIRAAKVNFGTSIFRVDTDQIVKNINATGVLRAGDVVLQYPDTVSIAVESRTRAAMALHLGKMHILDETGCVITSMNDVPAEDLVYVSGLQVQGCTTGQVIKANDDQLEAYCDVMQALVQSGANIYVSELNLSDVQNIRLITRTGITVELGDSANARDKIAWMQGAVADLEGRGQAGGTLDVRSGTKADYRAAG